MSEDKQKGVPLGHFPFLKDHKLAKAMENIDWNALKQSSIFENNFRPLQPLRRIIGLMILEHISAKLG